MDSLLVLPARCNLVLTVAGILGHTRAPPQDSFGNLLTASNFFNLKNCPVRKPSYRVTGGREGKSPCEGETSPEGPDFGDPAVAGGPKGWQAARGRKCESARA